MKSIRSVRPLLLAFVIGLGLIAQAKQSNAAELETITVAGGCFWCVEADFEKVKGVKEAVSGFTGGATENPRYKQVTAGKSGHYEAVQITYDPTVISRATLYDMFLRSIDVTDDGGQFCDRGASYRTAIFVHDAEARAEAGSALTKAENALGQTIVTPVLEARPFYPAEEYHQDYYKSRAIILTRFGPRTKAKAYQLYRNACGRDKRVKELWGSNAAFVG